MAVTRYETINSLGENFIQLVGKSLIPINILDYKVYYETYLTELKNTEKVYGKKKKTEAINMVAANYDISRRQMFHIIAFMESA